MTERLEDIARALVAPGKGILAADESSGAIKKRFDKIGVPSTEETRRDYREMMFRADAMQKYVSGVILYDEMPVFDVRTPQPTIDLYKVRFQSSTAVESAVKYMEVSNLFRASPSEQQYLIFIADNVILVEVADDDKVTMRPGLRRWIIGMTKGLSTL